MPLSLPDLIDSPALGPRPFLTWYGTDGERIELSATVTANWVAKTTNLLVEEFDAGPGTIVRLDLPPHWRTAVWALATWRTGACVLLDSSASADVIVTDRPVDVVAGTSEVDVSGQPDILAQVLPSLARRFDGELPPGAMDVASAVGSYADVIGYVSPSDDDAPAVLLDSTTTAHSGLGAWSTELPASARLAVEVGDRSPRSVEQFTAAVLGALRVSSSLVLLPAGHPDPSRILDTEHAVAHALP